jgi:hypothetical protein
VEALALEVPPLPIAAIYRQICQIAQKTDKVVPSYDVVYEVVREVPAGLLTLAHEGKKAYSATFDLVLTNQTERYYLLTLAQLAELLREFFLGVYHQRIHGETKAAPAQRWEKGAFLPRMPESLEQLDLLLLTVALARKVRNDGIHFLGQRHVDPTLAAYQHMLRSPGSMPLRRSASAIPHALFWWTKPIA